MKTITEVYKVYNFSELSAEAKEKAIEKWYENEDYSFLSESLNESLKALLEQYKIKEIEGLKLYYSLSYCQGDGLCFIGSFKWKNYIVDIKHSSNYYHMNSTNTTITTKNDNEAKTNVYEEFKTLYYKICKEIEKEGYSIIEYRMDNKEFNEHCEMNEYAFLENGIMKNA